MLTDREYMRDEESESRGFAPRTAMGWLIAINAAVFFGALVLNMFQGRGQLGQPESWLSLLGFHLADVKTLQPIALATFFTAMFDHANLMHLFFNMFGIFVFGREVERLLGPRKFVWLYIASGAAGNLIWMIVGLAQGQNAYILGASGALFGIIAAAVVLVPNQEMIMLPIPIPLKMRTLGIIYVVLQVVYMVSGSDSSVAHLAHLGGFAGGWLFIKFAVRRGVSQSGWKVIAGRVKSTNSGSRIPNAPKATSGVHAAVRRPSQSPAREAGALTDDDIDAILDKISSKGMKSLTRREREILDRASDKSKKEPS